MGFLGRILRAAVAGAGLLLPFCAIFLVLLLDEPGPGRAGKPGGREDSVRRPLPGARPPGLPSDDPLVTGRRDSRSIGHRALPPPSGGDPVIRLESGDPANASGTAFSLGTGHWVTARHLAWGCDRIGLVTGARRGTWGQDVRVHDQADLALFRADVDAPAIPVRTEPLFIGQRGFHYGFPQGEPGAMRSNLIGRATLRVRGTYRTDEPILAWAESAWVPSGERTLEGISGGPVVESNGHLVGVHIAGSIRRGRSFTTAPVSLRTLLDGIGFRPSEAGSPAQVTLQNYEKIGERLRDRLTMAKAICLVD